jgi:hypothetical protein
MYVSRGPSTSNNGILHVLEWDGVFLPCNTHNNQGVTKINSTNGISYFALPPNCILAIDGIISSDQPQ